MLRPRALGPRCRDCHAAPTDDGWKGHGGGGGPGPPPPLPALALPLRCPVLTPEAGLEQSTPKPGGREQKPGKTHGARGGREARKAPSRAARLSETIFKREESLLPDPSGMPPSCSGAFSLHSNVSSKKQEPLIYVTRSVSLSPRQNILIPRHLLVIASISEDFDKIVRFKRLGTERPARAERNEMLPPRTLHDTAQLRGLINAA